GSFAIVTTTSGQSVKLNSDGSYVYDAADGFYGTDSFAYKISDGQGGIDTATVTINVAGVPTLADRFFINEVDVNVGASTITINTDNGALPNTITTGVSRIEMLNNATNAVSTSDLRTVQFEIVNPDGHLDIIRGDQLIGLTVDKNGANINGSAISGNGRLVLYEPGADGIGIWQVYNNNTLSSSGSYTDTAWGLGSDVTKPVAVNLAQTGASLDFFAANGAKLSGLIPDGGETQTNLTGIGSLGQGPHSLGSVSPFVMPDRSFAWYSGVQLDPGSVPQDVLDAIASNNVQFNGSLASSQDHIFARVYDRYLASNKGSSVDNVFIDNNDAGDWTYGPRDPNAPALTNTSTTTTDMLTTGYKNAVLTPNGNLVAVQNPLDSADNVNPKQGTNNHGDVIAAITNEDGQTNAIFSGTGRGGAGHDFLYGVNTNDTLNGDGGNDFLFGSGGTDTLNGGTGGDRLIGGAGNDALTGGSGIDSFVLDSALSPQNIDTFMDFVSGTDKIVLDDDIFSAFNAAVSTTLNAADFVLGTAAQDVSDRIIYDQTTGNLYYDADGSAVGGVEAVQIALIGIGPHPAVASTDFAIVA
ncbi:MAG TPA: Ig-like domain-containing protein, partial [Azonexus sp.]|nr:Ig-like domain-containing protein [Azonexus sp.]